MMHDPMMDRMRGHRTFDAGEDFGGPPKGGYRRGGWDSLDGLGPEAFGPRAMPRRGRADCGRFAPDPHAFGEGPGRPGYGFPPGGMPPFGGPGGMPPHGGRPPHGLPPRRPDPAFLKRRIGEADLGELLDMAQRLSRRRPQGNPAHAQALILSILAGREALSQRQLQQMLGIQPGSLSELLNKLEAKGLLTREKAEDRRGNLLRITDAGRQAIPQEDDPEDDPFAPLSAEQQDQLSELLRALLNAWVDGLEPAPIPQRDQKPVEL